MTQAEWPFSSPSPSPAQQQTLWARDLTLPAVPHSLLAFQRLLDDLCTHAAIARDLRDDLQVVLDEVCANIFKHAYAHADGAPGAVRLLLRHVGASAAGAAAGTLTGRAAIELTVIDQGRPFNPLTRPGPDVSLPLEDRPLGGLGIHLLRQLTDSQHYRYSAAEGNRLTLVKHLH